MFYDDHWENLNDINKLSRASKDIYDRELGSISITMQKQITEDYAGMINMLKKYKRFKKFLNEVQIRIRFFDDSNKHAVIESGMPHTIRNTICLPIHSYKLSSKEERIKLLLHESVHIYQRNYPFEFNKFLTEEFDLSVNNLTESLHPNSRYNPDINGIVYADGGLYRVTVYSNTNPKSLHDSKLLEKNIMPESRRESKYEKIIQHFKHVGIQIEHPYEVFACVLSYYIFSKRACNCRQCMILQNWLKED